MMSILPSLLMSATATPSERKLVSTTVFFQLILGGAFFSPAATPVDQARASRQASRVQVGRFMAGPQEGCGSGGIQGMEGSYGTGAARKTRPAPGCLWIIPPGAATRPPVGRGKRYISLETFGGALES